MELPISALSAEEHIQAILLCVPRILGLFVFVPFFSTQFLPGIVRNSLLVVLAIYISPLALQDPATTINAGVSTHWIILASKELGIGLMMGFVVGLVFAVPQLIGDFIDNQRGTSMAEVFNPTLGSQASILGITLSLLVTTLFLIGGGLQALFEILFSSYRIIGVYDLLPDNKVHQLLEAITTIFTQMVKLGILLAAPIVLVMMMSEFGLGLVGRFVQQLQVFFLAMPIKSVIGIFLITIFVYVLLRVYEQNNLPLGPLRELIEVMGNA